MIKSLKEKVFKKNHSKNKTVILLSDDKIYSLRINFFFQFFLLISGIIVSSFITYHLTIYMKSQNSIQEKDHKIFVGAEINKNLSNHLVFVVDEISRIESALSELIPEKNIKKESSKVVVKQNNQNHINSEEEFEKAKGKIKSTVFKLDKTLDSHIKTMVSALHNAELGDLMKVKKIYNYNDYKNSNFVAKNINYSAMDIASSTLSEAKYKMEYLKLMQDLIYKMPITTPVKGTRITSYYGVRMHPILNIKMLHHGIDFKGPVRATIHATADAKVKFSGWSNSFGNVIILDHGDDIISIYAHLSGSKVKNNQVIKKNDIIGFQGSTGRSSGEHLHYEIRYKGRSINPVKFLQMNEIIRKNQD